MLLGSSLSLILVRGENDEAGEPCEDELPGAGLDEAGGFRPSHAGGTGVNPELTSDCQSRSSPGSRSVPLHAWAVLGLLSEVAGFLPESLSPRIPVYLG